MQHELAGFFLVGELHHQGAVVSGHIVVFLELGTVGLPILCLGVASVEDACDLASNCGAVVVLRIPEIFGQPSSVHDDGLFLATGI